MSGFVNTIDVLGDAAVTKSIIQKSIAEYKDDKVKTVGEYAFWECTALTMVDLPSVTRINNDSFGYCKELKSLILRSQTICTLVNFTALTGTPIYGGTGFIYVPSALVDSYKAAENWSNAKLVNQFRALEDYTVDGTITGALDPSKI